MHLAASAASFVSFKGQITILLSEDNTEIERHKHQLIKASLGVEIKSDTF